MGPRAVIAGGSAVFVLTSTLGVIDASADESSMVLIGGLSLYLGGVTDSAGMLTANLVGALVVVVPVVAAAAWCESGTRTATPGHGHLASA